MLSTSCLVLVFELSIAMVAGMNQHCARGHVPLKAEIKTTPIFEQEIVRAPVLNVQATNLPEIATAPQCVLRTTDGKSKPQSITITGSYNFTCTSNETNAKIMMALRIVYKITKTDRRTFYYAMDADKTVTMWTVFECKAGQDKAKSRAVTREHEYVEHVDCTLQNGSFEYWKKKATSVQDFVYWKNLTSIL